MTIEISGKARKWTMNKNWVIRNNPPMISQIHLCNAAWGLFYNCFTVQLLWFSAQSVFFLAMLQHSLISVINLMKVTNRNDGQNYENKTQTIITNFSFELIRSFPHFQSSQSSHTHTHAQRYPDVIPLTHSKHTMRLLLSLLWSAFMCCRITHSWTEVYYLWPWGQISCSATKQNQPLSHTKSININGCFIFWLNFVMMCKNCLL